MANGFWIAGYGYRYLRDLRDQDLLDLLVDLDLNTYAVAVTRSDKIAFKDHS